jgi:hypothetical protein
MILIDLFDSFSELHLIRVPLIVQEILDHYLIQFNFLGFLRFQIKAIKVQLVHCMCRFLSIFLYF